MSRKSKGYAAACYYGGKMMGRCTKADAEGYEQFMKSCNGSAARVLEEYAYFSPELRAILEKVAAAQHKESHPGEVSYRAPVGSPWGHVQVCEVLCPGVFLVSTASHGGIMVAKERTAILSPAARKCGDAHGGFLCFEEDCQDKVVLRELLDKKLWSIPDHISDKEAFEEYVDASIRQYNPQYWSELQLTRKGA